jgi:hypothetical protein
VVPVNFGGVAVKKKLLRTLSIAAVLALVNVPSASANCGCWTYIAGEWPWDIFQYCAQAGDSDYCHMDGEECIDYNGGCVENDPECHC